MSNATLIAARNLSTAAQLAVSPDHLRRGQYMYVYDGKFYQHVLPKGVIFN